MEYILDLLIYYEPTQTSVNGRYKLKISLPQELFKRWCSDKFVHEDSMMSIEHWRFEGNTLLIDLESFNDLGRRGKDVKRAFIRWLITELRKEYGSSVITVSY